MPRFSIVTPVYDPPEAVLRAMLRSVTAQANGDWELCLVDDASPSPHVARVLAEAADRDPRHPRPAAGGQRRHRRRLQRRPGHGHRRVRRAARPRRRAAPRRPGADRPGPRRHARGRLRSTPTRTRSTRPAAGRPVLQARLVARAVPHADVHLPRQRAAAHAGRGGRRVPRGLRGLAGLGPRAPRHRAGRARSSTCPDVLYHWRMLATSTAAGGEAAKPYAYEAGTRAIQAHCDRIGFPAVASSTATSTPASTSCARR